MKVLFYNPAQETLVAYETAPENVESVIMQEWQRDTRIIVQEKILPLRQVATGHVFVGLIRATASLAYPKGMSVQFSTPDGVMMYCLVIDDIREGEQMLVLQGLKRGESYLTSARSLVSNYTMIETQDYAVVRLTGETG